MLCSRLRNQPDFRFASLLFAKGGQTMSQQYGNLPRGGHRGFVEFVFLDGWTIFLTSAKGAADFDYKTATVFDATLPKYYGGEYDMDLARARRLKAMADEMHQYRNFKKAIVLHCNHGRSRSVICLGIYLMSRCGNSAQGAISALESAFLSAGEEGTPHFHAVGLRVAPALIAYENLNP
ncbi:MAG: hypothetical protein V7641_4661 [Blastocatellia bacterium]